MNKVLIIAVHPDDETLGCGGTLLKYKEAGDEIFWLIVTKASLEDGFSQQLIDLREKEIEQVCNMYGFNEVFSLGFSAMRVDEESMSTLIAAISKVINKVKPNIVFLPFQYDIHSDHRKVFEAAYSCTKSFRYPFIKKLYMMEVLSETEYAPSLTSGSFVPNVFVDITDYLDKKIEIMEIFKSEIGEVPFPRSRKNLEALATYRGCTAGCQYAESFMLLKEIV